MTMKCPCCGGEVTKLPVSALISIPMQPQHRSVAAALASAYPRRLPMGALIDALYANDPNGGPEQASNVIIVRVSQLRKKLMPYGWTVSSGVDGPGSHAGYRLEPAP